MKQRQPHTLQYIKDINKVLENADKPLTPKQIYETLIKEGKLEIDSYKRFNRYLQVGVKDGVIDKALISTDKKRFRMTRPFTKKQVIDFFEAIRLDEPRIAMENFIAFICALRGNEVLRLKNTEANTETCEVTISHGKNKIDDEPIVFPRDIIPIIQLWREFIGDSEYFIPNRIRGRDKAEYKSYCRDFNMILGRMGLDTDKLIHVDKNGIKKHRNRYTTHTWRKTRITFLKRYEGWDNLADLQKFSRHKCTDVLIKHYIYVDKEELKDKMNNKEYLFKRHNLSFENKEPTAREQIELMREKNKQLEIQLKALKEAKELKELEVNLIQN